MGGRISKNHSESFERMLENLCPDADGADRDALYLALQDLHTHQIELEQQNLELKEAQQEIEQSRDRYATLYDFAPVGYISLNPQGIIRDINLTGATLLGQARGTLIGKSLMHRLAPGSSGILLGFLRSAFHSEDSVEGEIQLPPTDVGEMRTIRLDGVVATSPEGERYCFTSLVDISESKNMERKLEASHSKLNSILTAAPIGIGQVQNRIFQWLSPRFLEMIGYPENELIGVSSRVIYPDDHEFERVGTEKYKQIAATGTGELETRFQCKDGSILDILLRSTLLDRNNPDTGSIFTALDITKRKQVEGRLHLAHSVIQNASEGVMITDPSLRIIEINPAFTEITGYTEGEVLGRRPDILRSGRHNLTFYKAMWKQLKATGEWQGEIWNRRKSGDVYPEWLTIAEIPDTVGKVTHYAGIFTDITNQTRARERLHRLAYYDPLTGLPNRELFRDRFEVLLSQAQRHGKFVALLFLDLDNFKNINDTQGHLIGDQLLREAAVRLRACVRGEDAVARLGGDEFTILVSDMEHQKDAEAVAHKIHKIFEEPFALGDAEYDVTVSIGISIFPDDSDDINTLIKQADTAMYKAKDAGRSTHCYYHPELSDLAQERMSIVSQLRHAVGRGQMYIHYQPQMFLRTGRILGVEALVRWRHPQLGVIPPSRFIPIAEQSGQIIALSEWITQNAIIGWKKHLAEPHDDMVPRLSINLSSAQFQKQDVYAFIADMLDQLGMEPCNLEVELTETVLVHDTKKAARILTDLDRLGVRIALDDFGTGYSSLNYLSKFPINTVKIDRSFIRNLMDGGKQTFLVSAIIAMSQALGIDVVAEGVETTGQLALLSEMGCDSVQGFLISHPKEADEMSDWMCQRVHGA